MEYLTAAEAAKKWGISQRRVEVLCTQGRIPGVKRISRLWVVPEDAEKPEDGRRTRNVKPKR